jgi:hypothetical protein
MRLPISRAGVSSLVPFHFHLIAKLVLIAAMLGAALLPVRALQADDQYLSIYGVIEQGDELATAGKTPQAIAKYQQADKALKEFRRTFPSYNPKMVSFRLNYLNEQVIKLSQPKLEVDTAVTSSAGTPVKVVDKNQPQLKLLSPGAEPRAVLRLQPQPGDKQVLTMVMKMAMGIEMAGQPAAQNVKIPPLKMDLAVEIKSVSDTGDIVYSIAYSELGIENEAGAAPEMVQAIKAALDNLSGMSGIGTNTSRGFSKGFAAEIPPGTDPQTHQMIGQMSESLGSLSSPLPEEAVGLGAKWETKMPIKSQGMTIDQTVVSELVGLEDGRARVKVSLTQRAANQKISNPSMPGVKFDLTKMTGSGQGETTLDFKQLLPAKAAMDAKTEAAMAFNAGNQKQAMKMAMDLRITLQNK